MKEVPALDSMWMMSWFILEPCMKLDCEWQSFLLYDINFSFMISISSAVFHGGSAAYGGDVHQNGGEPVVS